MLERKKTDEESPGDAAAAAGVDARNVAGGMTAWAAAGLPVVRDDGTPGVIA